MIKAILTVCEKVCDRSGVDLLELCIYSERCCFDSWYQKDAGLQSEF